MRAISYTPAYSQIDAAGPAITVAAPPAFAAGDLLVMGVIGGGTGGAVQASAPAGWTTVAGSGTPGVFVKTAGSGEPCSYQVSLGGTACAAAFTAAYPAGTVVSPVFAASADDARSFQPPFPAGVTTGQTVLLVAAAVASASDPNGNAGAQNVMIPDGWTTEVPVFGPSLPQNTSGVLPCAIGLASVAGAAAAPTLLSPQGCTIFAAYLVLDITGANDSLAVSATVGYPEGYPGLAVTVTALTGAATPAEIAAGGAVASWYAAGTSLAPAAAITPLGTGSLVYGALTANSGVTGEQAFAANAATVFLQNVPDPYQQAVYGTLKSAVPTIAGATVTLGGTAPASGSATAALAEIIPAPGQTLAEAGTVAAAGVRPGDFPTTSVTQTAIFRPAPAAGSLLVATVSANSLPSDGNATLAISDTSGLSWTPLVEQRSPSYSGVWAAVIPAPAG